MKKILIYVAVVAVMLSCLVVPSFAAENTYSVVPWDFDTPLLPGEYYNVSGQLCSDAQYIGTMYIAHTAENELTPGEYVCKGTTPGGTFSESYMHTLLVLISTTGEMETQSIVLGTPFVIPSGWVGTLMAQSQIEPPLLFKIVDAEDTVSDRLGIYGEAYTLFHEYIWGGAELTEYEDAVCVGLATAATLIVALLPFVVVLFVTKMVVGSWR